MGVARCLGIVCAVAMGIGAFTATQLVMAKDANIQTYQKYCLKGNVTKVEEAGLHAYEPMLGASFTCILTQFILALVEDPAGMLAWGLIATLLFPLTLLMYVEAGRYGAKGLVKWPVLALHLLRQHNHQGLDHLRGAADWARLALLGDLAVALPCTRVREIQWRRAVHQAAEGRLPGLYAASSCRVLLPDLPRLHELCHTQGAPGSTLGAQGRWVGDVHDSGFLRAHLSPVSVPHHDLPL